jgi:multidrug efflux pump subunit AcrA (membrane-fusion protein)
VRFRVNGYGDEEFAGRVRRVNPAANPTTRQVEVLVDFVGDKQPQLAGLYAEGRVETESRVSLTIPASAIVREGDKVSAFRVAGDKLQKVALKLGDRDPRTGDFAIAAGLAEGDRVLRYPTVLLKDGQPVQASSHQGATGVSVAASEARKP